MKLRRKDAADRRRRIILNNDGNEPVYLIKEPTAEEILKYRTSPFIGSHVDTLFYCTWSSGFGLFLHHTEVGEIFVTKEEMFSNNKMQELVDAGIDPLRVMNDFCHNHGLEFFWSMRMNDTHDGSSAAYGPVMFRANRFKQDHPEHLLGSKEVPPRYGAWTAVDYAHDEIRELTFRFVEEVCRNYNVDGIELDFYRHPVFFRQPSLGFPCSQVERDLMTGFIRRIRGMMEDEAEKRGRPFLLAVRVPDDVEYNRKIGIDLERWFAEDLVDLYIASGYLQLNTWEYSVRLGHRYGVKVYPSLDESRVREENATDDITAGIFKSARGSVESYRARAVNIWNAGADGVYLYNYFNPESPILREMGEPSVLKGLDKTYFASVRGAGRIAGDGFPHEENICIPTLNPQHPEALYPGKPVTVDILVGEDFLSQPDVKQKPRITLKLQFSGMESTVNQNGGLRVGFNGSRVELGRIAGGWFNCKLDPVLMKKGINAVTVCAGPDSEEVALWSDIQIAVQYS